MKEIKKDAAKAVDDFMRAWFHHDYDEMLAHCQKSWLSMKGDSAREALEMLFNDYLMTAWYVRGCERKSDVMFDALVLVEINGKRARYKIRVICEEMPYKPSVNGRWGVNPVSFRIEK